MTVSAAPGLLYLWDRRSLYLSTLPDPLYLSQAAATFFVSLGGPIRLRSCEMNDELLCHSALLPAGSQVRAVTAGAMVATCYLDVFGLDYAALAPRMTPVTGGLCISIENEQEWQQEFGAMVGLCQRPEPDHVYAVLNRLLATPISAVLGVDARVAEVVRLIKATVADNVSVEALAAQVNLSVPRLVQLFKQQVGVPIRRYRQWHRLYVTTAGVACGESLTTSALAAGFTDSSHFSNTFRAILGMKPTEVLSHFHRAHLFAPSRRELDASLCSEASPSDLPPDTSAWAVCRSA